MNIPVFILIALILAAFVLGTCVGWQITKAGEEFWRRMAIDEMIRNEKHNETKAN